MKPDFRGYASKAGVRCADGLTILAHAFKDKDGQKVPIVWQHTHTDPEMVLGHALIEDRPDGTYVHGFLNETPKGKVAKSLLQHGDIETMSIYANRLIKRGSEVVHGVLHEVSLVLSGANPGASIDYIALEHSDGTIQNTDDEAIIYTGLELEHAGSSDEGETMADDKKEETEDDKTLLDVYETMNEDQKELVHFLADKAGESLAQDAIDDEDDEDEEDSDDSDESDDDQKDKQDKDDSDDSDDVDNTSDDDEDEKKKKALQHDALNNQENNMTHRVFDKTDSDNSLVGKGATLSHDQISTIIHDAAKKGSIKESFIAHAGDYGIDDIDVLFPDAKAITNEPEFVSRRMEWVAEVIGKTKHVPYSRLKTLAADITADEARAKGYVTGTEKKDEVFGLLKRITTPTTVYKKQKLDRDDILDATTINIVVWLKAEMRLLLEEEIARAILIGDGREVSDPDKIKDPFGSNEGSGIRSIANDSSMYATQIQLAGGSSVETRIEELIRARMNYRGSGQPTLFTTLPFLTDILLHKDKMGRRIYDGIDEIASALMVAKIVTVEPLEGHQDIVGIFVNLADYAVGTDRGGEISFFDDFDIDFNQEKYLLETRISGALVKLKSAIVVRRALGEVVTPQSPSFDSETNTITIPAQTGVIYTIGGELVTGEEIIEEDVVVVAEPDDGYDFPVGVTTSWPFSYSE